MRLDFATHWLEGVRTCPSPNCDDRPVETAIDLLVIHAISLPPGQFGGPYIDALFTNCLDPREHPYFESVYARPVSSHVLIRRLGEVIQYVPFHRRAWHAGESNFAGRSRCNDFSIGIELEGTEDTPYESVQYVQLARISRLLMSAYRGITPARIVGHSDIAPGRKTDPGPVFDWRRLHQLLRSFEQPTYGYPQRL
jgi:N-acetyl-anhydromuramoyl-L-alanine amidase